MTPGEFQQYAQALRAPTPNKEFGDIIDCILEIGRNAFGPSGLFLVLTGSSSRKVARRGSDRDYLLLTEEPVS